ncbi:hypothetical protein F4821DRAFT_221876 [Hypoxylon rubiginosum]|uniref:Uncharacterized protein n=1 Tax=Hypoxylon rubiginosum TaxID=110542 RepID=A0ACC0DMS0_9PEZI|nr:hypothetical protein F4821DRAFT_221876 [Hypoxylon rubiginosum]
MDPGITIKSGQPDFSKDSAALQDLSDDVLKRFHQILTPIEAALLHYLRKASDQPYAFSHYLRKASDQHYRIKIRAMALGESPRETKTYIVVLAPNHLCVLINKFFSKSKVQDLCNPQPDDSPESKKHTPPSFKVLIYGRSISAKPAEDFEHFVSRLRNGIDVGAQTNCKPIVVTEKPEAEEAQDSALTLEGFRKRFKNIMPFATTEDHIIGDDELEKARENGGFANSKEESILDSKEVPLSSSETGTELSLDISDSEPEIDEADFTRAAEKRSDIRGRGEMRGRRTKTSQDVDLDAIVPPPLSSFRESPQMSSKRHRPKPTLQAYHELGSYSYEFEFGSIGEYFHVQASSQTENGFLGENVFQPNYELPSRSRDRGRQDRNSATAIEQAEPPPIRKGRRFLGED